METLCSYVKAQYIKEMAGVVSLHIRHSNETPLSSNSDSFRTQYKPVLLILFPKSPLGLEFT